MSGQGLQFGRQVSLIVVRPGLTTLGPFIDLPPDGLDLSEQRIKFEVKNADVETPNIAVIRVYNLNDQTARSIIKEYDTVVLQAGYVGGNFGIIFRGNIKQFRRGKESNIDTYLDILASDGDLSYNFGFINKSLDGNVSPDVVLQQASNVFGLPIDPNANQSLTGGILPRGKVLFGLMRTYMQDLAQTNSARWSIQNGTIVMIPLSGYLPGEVVQINSATGMIGVPEATDNGVVVQTLLNPLIKIGTRIQLNNKDVTQTIVKQQFFPSFTSGPTLVADVTTDGFYRVLVAEHTGDTRGQEWYTNVVCLSLDPSQPVDNSVQAFG